MEKTVTLTITPAPWSAEAANYLAGTIRGAPCYTVEDFRRELAENSDSRLYRVEDERGELVGFIVLRVERYSEGAEGVLVAAAGRIPGAALYAQVLPTLERMFQGVKSYRVEACRSAAVLQLMKAGYLPTHFVMRKAAAIEVPIAGDDLMEALQHVNNEATGGPDLRARPHKLHGGGGSSSSSSANTTNQTTNQIDRRLVVDSGSVGVSSDTSTVNVTSSTTTTDYGAVSGAGEISSKALDAFGKSIAFAQASDQETGKTLANVLGFAKEVFTTGLTVLDKAGHQVEAQTALVSQAYDNAKGEGTQKNLVAAAALAVVAVVAVKIWSKS